MTLCHTLGLVGSWLNTHVSINRWILLYYYLLLESFSHQAFHWSLSDCKSPQVSRTHLSILAVLNNAIVWMVSTRTPTSKSSSPFNSLFVTVPKAPITIGIIVIFMLYSFFNSLTRLRYLSFFSLSFSFFCGQPVKQSPQFWKFSFFVVDQYQFWSSGR